MADSTVVVRVVATVVKMVVGTVADAVVVVVNGTVTVVAAVEADDVVDSATTSWPATVFPSTMIKMSSKKTAMLANAAAFVFDMVRTT